MAAETLSQARVGGVLEYIPNDVVAPYVIEKEKRKKRKRAVKDILSAPYIHPELKERIKFGETRLGKELFRVISIKNSPNIDYQTREKYSDIERLLNKKITAQEIIVPPGFEESAMRIHTYPLRKKD